MRKYVFIFLGFLTGVAYVSCGGAGGIANTIASVLGAATDVTYDNTASGLTATTTQAALDELAISVDDLNKTGDNLAETLVGTWTGTHITNSTSTTISITFNADGTFTCDDGGGDAFSSAEFSCDDGSGSWNVLIRSIRINYTSSDYRILIPSYISSTQLEMSDAVNHTYQLTKS